MATRRLYSDLDLNGLKILNAQTPTDASDVTNKSYVDLEIQDTASALETRVTGAFTAADAGLQSAIDTGLASARADFGQADAALRAAFEGADTAIRAEFAGADTALRDELTGPAGPIASGDAAVRSEFASADSALETRLRTEISNAGGTSEANLRAEFTAADDAVRGDLAAGDAALRTAFELADTDLRNRIQSLDTSVTAADAALAGDITALSDAVTAQDASIRAAFAAADSQIRTDFTAADAALSTRIDDLQTDMTQRASAQSTTTDQKIADGDAATLATARNEIAAGDAATRAYAEQILAQTTSGQVLKGSVRLAVEENLDLAAPPATIQGETLAEGDIVLLTAQTDGTENGPYVLTGGTLSRAGNWDTAEEARVGSYWVVREGTRADNFALLGNDTFALGTTVAEFVYISAIPDPLPPVTEAIGGAAAGTAYTVTHNFGTTDVTVAVIETASGYDVTSFIAFRKTVSAVVVEPDVALAAGELTVTVGRARG